jgi:hypothetical protein
MGVDYDRSGRSPAFSTGLIADSDVAWGGSVDVVSE